MTRYIRIHLIFACLLSLLLGCSSDTQSPGPDAGSMSDGEDSTERDHSDAVSSPDTEPQDSETPSVYNASPVDSVGPYRVGYRTETIEYQPIQLDEPRELRLAIWYPTEDTGGTAANYAYGLYPAPRPDVWEDASPIEAAHPVMLYSHGNFGFAEAHYSLCEHFASHGYLVIAPDHTGNTWNAFSDRDTDTYLNRPQDLSASLTAIAPDAEHVAVVGHSYGGYTALAIAGAEADLADCDVTSETSDFCSLLDDRRRDAFGKLRDDRVDIVVPMASGNSRNIAGDGAGVAAIEIPVFLLTGSLDQSNSNAADGDPYWDGLDGMEDRRLNLKNGGHQSFASTCLHYEVGISEGDGCVGEEFIEPERAIEIINEYVLAFARYHLTDDSDQKARLDGPASDPNIELSAK